jgi:hypothetical protein
MVLGSQLPEVIYSDWWKAMEFTFGLMLGASLGWAAWKSRNEIQAANKPAEIPEKHSLSIAGELAVLFVVAVFTHWLWPNLLESFAHAGSEADNIILVLIHGVARVLLNYGFYGFVFVLVILRFPQAAWQIGITLTFCHAAIDLIRDFYPDLNPWAPFTMHFLWVFLMTAVVAGLTAFYSRRENSTVNLFLLLIWSGVAVSLLRLAFLSGSLSVAGMSFCEIICDRFFVDIFFIVNAIVVSRIIITKKW